MQPALKDWNLLYSRNTKHDSLIGVNEPCQQNIDSVLF